MQASPKEPETASAREEREKPRMAADARGGANVRRDDTLDKRREESLEEPGYGHGV